MATLFTARYDGFCRRCADDFVAGDEVAYDEYDEIICSNCAEEDNAKLREQEEAAPRTGWRQKKD